MSKIQSLFKGTVSWILHEGNRLVTSPNNVCRVTTIPGLYHVPFGMVLVDYENEISYRFIPLKRHEPDRLNEGYSIYEFKDSIDEIIGKFTSDEETIDLYIENGYYVVTKPYLGFDVPDNRYLQLYPGDRIIPTEIKGLKDLA